MRKHVNSITARGLLPGSVFGNARLSARPWAPHHRHGAGCCQRLAFDHVGVDVAGQHDDERGPGFSSPDQPDGCLSLKLDDGRLCKLVLVPQRVRLGGGRPGRGERRRLRFAVSPQTELRRVNVDVALPAQLDGQADSALVQTDEDERGFRDGLGRPMGGNQPSKLEQTAVAVAPGLALVEEAHSPELFKPGQVDVGVGAQAEGVAGGLTGRESSWQPPPPLRRRQSRSAP